MFLKIFSFNLKENTLQLKQVLDTSEHKSEKNTIEIEYDGGSLIVTEDHKIWSVTRNLYIEASELQEGEEVLAN